MTDLAAHYLEEARRQMRGHKRMAEGAISQLKDEDLFATLDPEANSVAILIKHLAGNMRSRFTRFPDHRWRKARPFPRPGIRVKTAAPRGPT